MFEKKISICFYSRIQGWQFVSSCRKSNGDHVVCHISYGGQMVTGMLEFKKSMKVHVRDVPKEILQGDHSPRVITRPHMWINPTGLRFMLGNLMYAS